jgi:hypothetical protein
MVEKLRKRLHDPDVRLVLSLVGGTLVWGFYFSGVHALNSLACRFGWFGLPADSTSLKLVQVAVTVFAGGLIIASGYNVYRLWRGTRRRTSDDAGVPGDPLEPGNLEQTIFAYTPFMAFVLLLLHALYLLIIIASLGPIILLANCAG